MKDRFRQEINTLGGRRFKETSRSNGSQLRYKNCPTSTLRSMA